MAALTLGPFMLGATMTHEALSLACGAWRSADTCIMGPAYWSGCGSEQPARCAIAGFTYFAKKNHVIANTVYDINTV